MAREIKILIAAITVFLGTMLMGFIIIKQSSQVLAANRPPPTILAVTSGSAIPASEAQVPPAFSLPPAEVGDYAGTHQIMDEADPWTGDATLTVNPEGTISGATTLPSSDGLPINQFVEGTVTAEGKVILNCDAMSVGEDGPIIHQHMFTLLGKMTSEGNDFEITASGVGNQGYNEKIVASR